MYLYKKEYDKAERYFLQYGEVGGKGDRSLSRLDLALIPLFQGKYDLAANRLQQGITSDELDMMQLQELEKHYYLAEIYIQRQEFEKAIENGRKMIELIKETFPENLYQVKAGYGIILVFAGQTDSANREISMVSIGILDKVSPRRNQPGFKGNG
jgi:tetratricopeptide (TPR) repeat protein